MKKVWILISLLLMKPADLDLQFFQSVYNFRKKAYKVEYRI